MTGIDLTLEYRFVGHYQIKFGHNSDSDISIGLIFGFNQALSLESLIIVVNRDFVGSDFFF